MELVDLWAHKYYHTRDVFYPASGQEGKSYVLLVCS
jgi:hypothetical protein